MKILVTGGNTEIPIDKVRCISNIFHGRTAVAIAAAATRHGHDVCLVGNRRMGPDANGPRAIGPFEHRFVEYRTYDDLIAVMEREVTTGGYDAVIHSAAVSDYKVAGVYAPANGPFEASYGGVQTIEGLSLEPVTSSGKVPSTHQELFIRLTPTEKIVDKIRSPWGFGGVLVKFKLQVDMSDDELHAIARKSMATSSADLIVANCLEWARDRAFVLGKVLGNEVKREDLADYLVTCVEAEWAAR